MSARKVVVIGAGPAGYVCAIRLAQMGQQVTVVEKEYLGGTCLNVGCIPSKALIAAGSLMNKISHASAMGISADNVKLDVEKLVGWKAGIVGKLTGGIGILLKNHKVKVVMGTASVKSKNTVEVVTDSGKETLQADDIVIATGSIPIAIPGFAFDEEDVWSSTGALRPNSIPEHLVVIGGGYIGLELGMMYKKLGSDVTVVEFTGGALPGQDPECVKAIERSLKKMKIKLMTESQAMGYERKGQKSHVRVKTKKGEQTIECDQILSTVGRRPYSEGLGLENAGLKTDERGFLAVDKQMRTSVPNIYAIGDIAGQPMLAHKGSKEGLVAAAVISGKPEEYDVRCVPAVIFTSPEMASVGKTADECKKEGLEIKEGSFPFAASGRAMSLMETDGFCKIISDAKTDEVLGVHMVGPEVTELIAEAALAIEMGATVEDIARTIHAHPTLPEAVMEAAEAVHGMAVHIFQKPRALGACANRDERVTNLLDVRRLGRCEYAEAYELQKELLEARIEGRIGDTLILCEHDPVYTVGRGTDRSSVADVNAPIFEIERGGEATYHGPGQLVVYPILLLEEGRRDLHRYLFELEEVVIRVLAEFAVAGVRDERNTGVWIADRKACSVGVAVRRWVTWHGFALNVHTDLGAFGVFNPCGLDPNIMTRLVDHADLGPGLMLAEVLVVKHFCEVFGKELPPPVPLASPPDDTGCGGFPTLPLHPSS